MNYQYVYYIWPLIVSAFVTLLLALYALRHRDVRGALPFGLCMLLSSLWACSYALELSATDLPTMLFWSNLPYLSYTICPVLWLIMVLLYIERARWITRRNISLLLILPAVTLVLLWSGDPFSLVRQNVILDTSGVFPAIGKTFGPWFWLIFIYSDLLNLISMVLMGWTLRRRSLLYRRQVLVLFIGLGLVILQNAAYVFGVFPARYLDLTPVVIGISGIIIAWGIFSYQLFNIVPVARENIIENMADGLIVLDSANRIADINPTAKNIFGQESARLVGRDARAFFSNWPAFIRAGSETEDLPGEFVIETDGCIKIYEVSSSTLYGRSKKRNGTCLIFHDITDQRKSQSRLLEQQKALAVSEERERLARDLHDNLGQVFGFINVQAQAIKRDLSGAGVSVALNKLDRLIEVTQSTHQKMREYIHSVKNIAAIDADFATALKQEVEQVRKQTGLAIRLDIHDELTLTELKPSTQNHLMGIIKETLNNIQKHAGAKTVSIVIRGNSTGLYARIADDGKGFDIASLEKKPLQGLGLNIMKKRAREIGGLLEINTSPGKGASVTLTVPLIKPLTGVNDESDAG